MRFDREPSLRASSHVAVPALYQFVEVGQLALDLTFDGHEGLPLFGLISRQSGYVSSTVGEDLSNSTRRENIVDDGFEDEQLELLKRNVRAAATCIRNRIPPTALQVPIAARLPRRGNHRRPALPALAEPRK